MIIIVVLIVVVRSLVRRGEVDSYLCGASNISLKTIDFQNLDQYIINSTQEKEIVIICIKSQNLESNNFNN